MNRNICVQENPTAQIMRIYHDFLESEIENTWRKQRQLQMHISASPYSYENLHNHMFLECFLRHLLPPYQSSARYPS
jgi:hypothetical protein